MELIKGNVILKFNKEEIEELDRVIEMLYNINEVSEKLGFEGDYDTSDLDKHYSAFEESWVIDLENFSRYIKENSYAITFHERK